MGRTNIAFFQSPTQGDTGTKCADVVIDPTDGDIPLTIDLLTPQTNGHIFYLVGGGATASPQHVGDNAVAPTVRVGTNHASVFIGAGVKRYIAALCYESGKLDSNITRGGPYLGGPSG